MIQYNKYMRCRFKICALIIYMPVSYVRLHRCQSGPVKCCSTRTVIIYMRGASQTPSLHIAVCLGLL